MQQKKSAVFYTEYIFHSDVDKLYLKDCRITLNVYDYICQKDRVWDVSLEHIWKNHFLLFGEKKPWACVKDGVRGKFCCNDNNTTNQ